MYKYGEEIKGTEGGSSWPGLNESLAEKKDAVSTPVFHVNEQIYNFAIILNCNEITEVRYQHLISGFELSVPRKRKLMATEDG
jgi:hypothetical protein